MKTRFALFLPLLILVGCAGGPSSFSEMDLDRNGHISRGEFTDAIADMAFAANDRNGDGFVDRAEWRATEGGSDALFRSRDLSRNSRISRQEWRLAAEKNGSMAALFRKADANADGYLDREEARRYRATLR